MDLNYILTWTVALSAGAGLFRLVRARAWRTTRGWLVVFAALLAITGALLLVQPAIAGWVGGALWLVSVVLPSLGMGAMQRALARMQYARARRIARVLGLFHPADGWRDRPLLLEALDLAQRGRIDEATQLLTSATADPRVAQTPLGRSARLQLYRIEARWQDLLDWATRQIPEGELVDDPAAFLSVVRALGETGRVEELFRAWRHHKATLERPALAAVRDGFLLYLFAFTGRVADVESLFSPGGRLATSPGGSARYWIATARLARSADDPAARADLESLAATDGDAILRAGCAWRLAHPPSVTAAATVTVTNEATLDELRAVVAEERRFGGVTTATSRPYATWSLIALNGAMFVAEISLGGATESDALFRLGALWPDAVLHGGWWRLGACMFLHFGAVHLAMNMIALLVLGPWVETALGRARYVLLYLFAGLVGSAMHVALARAGWMGPQLMVGASGCVMGLVGATAGILLRGWRREGSTLARRRLLSTASIVALQVIFDLMTPQVSFLAHASGTLAGFVLGLALGDRRRAR